MKVLLSLPHKRLRLQNSTNFCVFKNARAVKQKVCNEAENRERDWEETQALWAYEALARTTIRHALPISLLILREKTDCFAVYKRLDLRVSRMTT